MPLVNEIDVIARFMGGHTGTEKAEWVEGLWSGLSPMIREVSGLHTTLIFNTHAYVKNSVSAADPAERGT